jgi:hypothetical protein
MGKLGATGMAVALCAGLALASARADEGDGGDLRSMPPAKPSWWSGMFGGKETVATPKKLPPPEVVPTRVVASSPATVQAREESALHRRQQVCDELVEIADRKGDEALREQAYQLWDKAWAVYQQRTSANVGRTFDKASLTRPTAPDPARRTAARETAPWNQRGESP